MKLDSWLGWLGWVTQGVVGIAFNIPWFVVAPLMLVSGTLLWWSTPLRASPPADPHSTRFGYHSHKASNVLMVGVEIGTVFSLLLLRYGPSVGLESFASQMVVICAYGMAHWGAFQWARRRWPAGSD